MKQNTKTTTKKISSKAASVKSTANTGGEVAVYSTMTEDVKSSILVLSLIINLYIFTTWLVLQVTNQYDSQLYSFLFSR